MTVAPPTPWYRQFWPWFLIAIPAVSVIGGIVMIWLAGQADLDLIDDNYYQSGLDINQRIARDNYAAQMGVSANLLVAAKEGSVTLYLFGDADAPAEIQLNLASPGNSSLDRITRLRHGGDRIYRGNLTLGSAGRYYIELLDGNRQWRLSGQAVLPGATPVQLAADNQ